MCQLNGWRPVKSMNTDSYEWQGGDEILPVLQENSCDTGNMAVRIQRLDLTLESVLQLNALLFQEGIEARCRETGYTACFSDIVIGECHEVMEVLLLGISIN